MFYLIYGDDAEKRTKKRDGLLSAMKKKRPLAEVFAIEGESFEEESFSELTEGQGLFERKFIILGRNCFTEGDGAEFFLKNLNELKKSENVFLFTEGVISKTLVKKIEKSAEQVFLEGKSEKQTEKKFNMFSLTDALGARDKKTLWVLYQKALRENLRVEDIHGILFWQFKMLSLARDAQTAEEVGMKEYPFRKAKQYLGNYPGDELRGLRREFVALYHDARRGIFQFEEGLERFILGL